MTKQLLKVVLGIMISLLLYGQAAANIKVIKVVAAENFYGNVAELIGGDDVEVTSIISNPNADPHLFTISTNTAVAINNADVIIYNGAGYDPWIKSLLHAKKNHHKVTVINVSQLVNVKSHGNPHLWYDPKTMPIVAQKLKQTFSALAPTKQQKFALNLATFGQRFQAVNKKIADLKTRYQGTAVTATEPVFGYMADALGLKMLGEDFQWKIMNDAEPTPKMLTHYRNLFKQHKIKVLFYNQQVEDNTTKNILTLARKNHIPSVGVAETMPLKGDVITWFKTTLANTQQALDTAVHNTEKTTVQSVAAPNKKYNAG